MSTRPDRPAKAEVSAEVIAEREHRKLSKADQEAFFEALMDPPLPNEKMLAAALRYNEFLPPL